MCNTDVIYILYYTVYIILSTYRIRMIKYKIDKNIKNNNHFFKQVYTDKLVFSYKNEWIVSKTKMFFNKVILNITLITKYLICNRSKFCSIGFIM